MSKIIVIRRLANMDLPDVQQICDVSVFQIARRFISFSNHYAEVVHDLICDVSSTTQFQAIAPRILDA